MKDFVARFKEINWLDALKSALSSRFFPFFTGALVLLCYYLSLDIVTIYILGITGFLMVLLLDDLTPIIPQFLFLDIIISYKNSPSEMASSSDYFTQPAILAQIGVVLSIYLLAIAARIFLMGKRRTFKPTPLFFGLCALSLTFLLNGVGARDYNGFDFIYGLIMAAVFLVIFVLVSGNVKLCDENYEKIGWGFFAFSLVLVTELAVKYFVNRSVLLDADGELEKELIVFGWGIWNTMGMLIVISIPAVAFLASRYKYGFAFVFYITLLFVCAFLTLSRQAMLGAVIVYPLSLVLAIVKSKRKAMNAVAVGGLVLIGIIIIAAKWEAIIKLLGSVWDGLFYNGEFSGNGRMRLLRVAMDFFVQNPVFGSGLWLNYSENDFTGLMFVPEFACNTYAEMLAACGMAGFVAYLVHRVQTFIDFAQYRSFNKLYIGLLLAALLIMSMFDNHMFNIFPNIIYSALLVFATGNGSEGKALLVPPPIRRKKEEEHSA